MNKTKHLINTVTNSVNENLYGMVCMNDDLLLANDLNAVIHKDYLQRIHNGKVLLISGGEFEFFLNKNVY